MGTEPAPPSAYEDRPRAQERLALLAKQPTDLESGSTSSCSDGPEVSLLRREADTDERWRVVGRLQPCRRLGCGRGLELVELHGANFGVRWGGAAPAWLVGPHWYLMAATWSVFALLALGVTVSTAPMARAGETVTGVLLSTACLGCYALVGCSDPGIVPPISSPPDESYTYCDQCESYRPDGALHCMDCRVCIDGYDHHCPWTGKCVGRGNARYFYAWLLLLVLAFVFEVIEFTTYMLPPTGEPYIDSSDDSFDVVMPSFPPIARP